MRLPRPELDVVAPDAPRERVVVEQVVRVEGRGHPERDRDHAGSLLLGEGIAGFKPFLNYEAFLIVMGGTFCSLLVNYPIAQVFGLMKVLKKVMTSGGEDTSEIITSTPAVWPAVLITIGTEQFGLQVKLSMITAVAPAAKPLFTLSVKVVVPRSIKTILPAT